MIKDRPAHLLADEKYKNRPKPPYLLNWKSVPELVHISILDLGGIQPITGAMAEAARGILVDQPSEGEIALFREAGTQFQMISVVASVVAVGESKKGLEVTPFSLSLIPASKRGKVETKTIETIVALGGGEEWQKSEPCYFGYDPFVGDWDLYGLLRYLGSADGYLDELGLVVGSYFLATEFDFEDVVMMKAAMPSEKLERKYRRKRIELLFRPFEKVESPIELFLIQELARQGVHPAIQMLIMDDGRVFPSWYHFWHELTCDEAPGLVTEADLYFPEQKLAVFCDGAHHLRLKQRKKDEAIVNRLSELGIRSVRLPGRQIVWELEAAGRTVLDALDH
jgi:hypothetical protein